MGSFEDRVRDHAAHVAKVGPHCTSEETTKQALILPLLDILGYSPYDPFKVKAEYDADVPGVKRTERVDYAIFSEGQLVMFIEAKAYGEKLSNHAPQLARYFNATDVCVAAITNGLEWRFFADLQKPNVMDGEPFFALTFSNLKDADVQELQRFCYGTIKADALRTVAEELTLLNKFQAVIDASLRDPDEDFVKFVATKAMPSLRLTTKTIEGITPLVKRAVAAAMSRLVVNSLNAPAPAALPDELAALAAPDSDIVNPDNPRIITTQHELRLVQIVKDVLAKQVEEEDVIGKDTESYYTVLYQGKNNRWLIRYNANRRQPTVQFQLKLTDRQRAEIERAGLEIGAGDAIHLDSPEHLMRIPGLLFDALAYARDDANFKRVTGEVQA